MRPIRPAAGKPNKPMRHSNDAASSDGGKAAVVEDVVRN